MAEQGADLAEATCRAWDTRKWFVSSEGHRIDQHIRECGAGISATAIGDGETQVRSYPAARGQYKTLGWEFVDELDLEAHAARVGSEARALLSCTRLPERRDDAHPRVRTAGAADPRVGRARDRARPHPRLGGGLRGHVVARSRPARVVAIRVGADEHHRSTRRFEARSARSATTTRARRPACRDAVRNGMWVGVLAGRDSAAVAGLDYAGSVRADGWARLPMVRMTNVGLEPGPHTLDEIIAATDDGIYMETNRSWSIDDRRLNFQFGTEVGYEVKHGQLGRLLRNPTYTGIGPQFWSSMDMLSSEIEAWGTPNCGKGQPGQIGHTGHPAAPARFRNVRVGVRA